MADRQRISHVLNIGHHEVMPVGQPVRLTFPASAALTLADA